MSKMVFLVTAGKELELLFLILFVVIVIVTISLSVKGKAPKLRRLAALDAIDDLIGRSTEMGRPVLATPGHGRAFNDTDSAPQYMAFLSILSYVAQKAYAQDTRVIVHTAEPAMVVLCAETMQEASIFAGSPEIFQATDVRYFGSADGLITATFGIYETSEKPGSQIMVGPLLKEALYLAYNAQLQGAVQIGGTAAISQMPYIAACCDYILIGEEVYCAGAYLSNEPTQIGSIWGQDMLKIIALALIFGGFILSQFMVLG